jgi:phage gpG-like protein
MSGLADLTTAASLAAAIDLIRFDFQITSFEFKPSLGIVTKSIEDVMTISILENFMSGGRPPWDSLAPTTVAKRQKENAGTMILVRSGSLAEVASSKGIWSIGKTTATIRDLPEKVWYGKIHQGGYGGSQYGAGNWFKKYQNAARKSLGPDEDQQEVDKLAFKMFDKRLMSQGPAPKGAPSIPARPFAMFQEEDIDAIQNIFLDWLEEKVREAGLR